MHDYLLYLWQFLWLLPAFITCCCDGGEPPGAACTNCDGSLAPAQFLIEFENGGLCACSEGEIDLFYVVDFTSQNFAGCTWRFNECLPSMPFDVTCAPCAGPVQFRDCSKAELTISNSGGGNYKIRVSASGFQPAVGTSDGAVLFELTVTPIPNCFNFVRLELDFVILDSCACDNSNLNCYVTSL